MPHSQILQKLALEGPLSVRQLVILGLVMAGIMAWLAWAYSRRAGTGGRFLFLFLMRLGALLTVLWMLAGATNITVRRDAKPKSVLFMVDSSASMGLVDAVDGSGGTVRWAAPENKLSGSPPVGDLDEAIGTLQSARSDVTRLRQISPVDDPDGNAQKLWDEIKDSVDSAASEIGKTASEAGRSDSAVGAELGRVSAFLKENLARMGAWKKSTPDRSREDRLDETTAFISGAIQRIERQSQMLAAEYERNTSAQDKRGLAADSQLSRHDKVAAWLDDAEKSWLKDISARANVERFTFSGDVLPVAGTDWDAALGTKNNPANGSTDIAAALNRIAQESAKESIDAVVMVTDGGHNAPSDPHEAAAALHDVPLYIVPIGTVEMPRDVVLHHVHAPRALFKNDTAVIDAMVTAYSCEGEQLQVELLSDGVVVDKHVIDVNGKMFDGRVRFQWKGVVPGKHSLRVRVLPVAHELTLDNNEARVELEVMEDTIHVLVADDLPRWEFRYIVNLFKRETNHIDYEQLLFEPNDENAAGAQPTFPRTLDGWRKYRVVIIGDVGPNQLNVQQQELLRKYVAEEGGNLIIIAGPTAMPQAFANQPLAGMIPAVTSAAPPGTTQPFSLVVTGEGSTSVATQLDDDPLASERVWREMSSKLPIYNLSPVAKPKPTSHVLIAATTPRASAEQEAFLSWQYVGLGRVVYIAAPVTYQLRYQNGDLYHNRFWGQLLRWAIARDMSTGSKTVRLITDKTAYGKGETAQIVVRLSKPDGDIVAGAPCQVDVRRDGKVIRTIPLKEDPSSPGVYRASLDDLPLGALTLRAAGSTVESLLALEQYRDPVEQIINIDPQASTEMNSPLCNLPLLGEIADTSGGSITPPASIKNALAHVNLIPDIQETVVSREAIWDQWVYLWIFFGFIAIEWLARKRWRMV